MARRSTSALDVGKRSRKGKTIAVFNYYFYFFHETKRNEVQTKIQIERKIEKYAIDES